MLAITAIIPLLLTAAVSASPFTISGHPARISGNRNNNNYTLTTAAPDSRTLITPTAVTVATAGAARPPPPPPPGHDAPRPTQPPRPPQDLRVDAAGFAVSSADGAGDGEDDDNNAGGSTPVVATQAMAQAAAAATDAPPADVPEADADLARLGYSQTTYYACETFARATHCGWHVPVVHVAGGAAEGGRGRGVGGAAVMAAACGMVVNWALGW